MITFKQFLIEIFNYDVHIKWVYLTDSEGRAEFEVNNVEYIVLFGTDENDSSVWEVYFDLKYKVHGHKPYEPTLFGNQFTVLSAVKTAIIEFARKVSDIKRIKFTADSPSRQRAYDVWVRYLQKELPGRWELTTSHRGVKRYSLTNVQYSSNTTSTNVLGGSDQLSQYKQLNQTTV